MRIARILACATLVCFSVPGKAATPPKPIANRARPAEPLDPQRTLRELENPDPKARAEAVAKLNDSLAMTFGHGPSGVKTSAFVDPLLQAVLKAITDSDAEVRRQGFGALNVIAHVNVWARMKNGQLEPNAPVAIDLSREPRIRAVIIQHLDDPSWEVREFAIYALGLGYLPSTENERILLERWRVENARPFNRPAERIDIDEARQAISQGLRAGQYGSKETIQTLIQMLDDRRPEIRSVAAVNLSELKVREAIPKIMSNLREGDAYTKRGAAEALGNYGSAAKDQLPELEAMAARAKEGESKQELESAIKKIKEAK